MGVTALPDCHRLQAAFNFIEADRVPHVELWITSQTVVEYVLGRKLPYAMHDAAEGESTIAPADYVEFAVRTGQDAIGVPITWQPGNVFEESSDGARHYVGGSIRTPAQVEALVPPSADGHVAAVGAHLDAAEGTGVGVFPIFMSFFSATYLAMGLENFWLAVLEERPVVERLMDRMLEFLLPAMTQAMAQYGAEVPFVGLDEDIAINSGLLIRPAPFRELFVPRMRRLIEPALQRGKPVVLHTDGKLDDVLPILHELGIRGVHPVQPECNDIYSLKRQWQGKMVLFGNISTALLSEGSEAAVRADVARHVRELAVGGGYVLGSSTSIYEGIRPAHYMAMVGEANSLPVRLPAQ